MKNRLLPFGIIIFFTALLFGSFLFGGTDAQAQDYGTYSCSYSAVNNNCYSDPNNCTNGGKIPPKTDSKSCDYWDGVPNAQLLDPTCTDNQNESCLSPQEYCEAAGCSDGYSCQDDGRGDYICQPDDCRSTEITCDTGYKCGRDVFNNYECLPDDCRAEEITCDEGYECVLDVFNNYSCREQDCMELCIADRGSLTYCEDQCAAKATEGESCAIDNDCADGLRCDDNTCVIDGCTSTELGGVGKCSDGYYCDATTCVPYEGGEGDACSTDEQCGDGLVCNPDTLTCEVSSKACFEDCFTGSNLRYCEETCDIDYGDECVVDTDCDADTQACVDGECTCTSTSCGEGYVCYSGECQDAATICEAQDRGLVPCGGPAYDPETGEIVGQCPRCTLKHVFIMLHDIVEFIIWILAPILVTIMVVYGGITILTGAGNPGRLSKGKSIITWALIGYIIILLAWIIVNTIFTFVGLAEWLGPENWRWFEPIF